MAQRHKRRSAPARRRLRAHAWGGRAHVCKRVFGCPAMPLTPPQPSTAPDLGNPAPGSRGWVGTRRNNRAGKNGEGLRRDTPHPALLQMQLCVCVCVCVCVCACVRACARYSPGILGGVVTRVVCHSGSLEVVAVGPWVSVCKAVGDWRTCPSGASLSTLGGGLGGGGRQASQNLSCTTPGGVIRRLLPSSKDMLLQHSPPACAQGTTSTLKI